MTRFYPALDPMALLYQIPVRVIRVYAADIPRLQAQESLREADRIAVGTGSLKRSDAREIRRRWARDAGVGRRRQTQRGTTRQQQLEPKPLGVMGIKFIKVPRRA